MTFEALPVSLKGRDEHALAALLSDESARRVLSTCIEAAHCVREIIQATDLGKASAYRHVRDLVSAGLLVVERSAMTPDGKRYELYRASVRSIRVVVDREGTHTVWEPRIRMDALEPLVGAGNGDGSVLEGSCT